MWAIFGFLINFILFMVLSAQICCKTSIRKTLCKKLSLRSLLYTFVFAVCWFTGVLTRTIQLFQNDFSNDVLNVIHTFLSVSQPFWIAVVFIPAENVLVELGFWTCLKWCFKKCQKKEKEDDKKEKEDLKEPLIQDRNPILESNVSFHLDYISRMDEEEEETMLHWMKEKNIPALPDEEVEDEPVEEIKEHFDVPKPKYGGKVEMKSITKDN